MEITIKPKKTISWVDLTELWQYRELLYFFSWRDLKVRYKQTAIGVVWAIFQPFITMVVFTVVFSKLAKIPSDNVPYPIFVYVGLLIWQFFSQFPFGRQQLAGRQPSHHYQSLFSAADFADCRHLYLFGGFFCRFFYFGRFDGLLPFYAAFGGFADFAAADCHNFYGGCGRRIFPVFLQC